MLFCNRNHFLFTACIVGGTVAFVQAIPTRDHVTTKVNPPGNMETSELVPSGLSVPKRRLTGPALIINTKKARGRAFMKVLEEWRRKVKSLGKFGGMLPQLIVKPDGKKRYMVTFKFSNDLRRALP